MADARTLAGDELAAALRDSRATTLSLVADLDAAAWALPRQPGVNPIAWELGHLAWFAEFWILRGPHCANGRFVDAAAPARIAGSDALYDSARLAHAARWQHEWPARDRVLEVLASQLEACIAAIPNTRDDEALYFHRLVLFHEDMHGEAFAWLRAAQGHAAPSGRNLMPMPMSIPAATPIRVAGGDVRIGRDAAEPGFAFDNELGAHVVRLADFELDAAPVDNASFARFVEAGGYRTESLWPGSAGAWKASARVVHPARWRRGDDGGWEERRWGGWWPLDAASPVVHVNAYEAEAYAHWAGRRLPRAAEWEHAAQSTPMRWGRSVWEWTADAFTPYAGFVPGPYADYSAPWFGSHRELRGGSFAAHARMHDRRYRNFFTPERCELFAGFRTAKR